MDSLLLLLRLGHVGGAMIWFGGAIGGLAGMASLVGGMVLVGPSIAEQTAVHGELAASRAAPNAIQRERLARAERRMQLAMRIDLPRLLLAGLTMAAGRQMTAVDAGDRPPRPGRAARCAALAFVLPAIGFGLPTPFVIDHLRRTGELPMTPFGFRSHAGPFERLGPEAFTALAWALVGVCLLDALAGTWLWQGRRRGARLGQAITPATFGLALGFAFPFLLAALPIRLILVAVARPSLR